MKQCIYRTDYKLVVNSDRRQFETHVNELLHSGWKFHKHLIIHNGIFNRELTKEVMIKDSNGNDVEAK